MNILGYRGKPHQSWLFSNVRNFFWNTCETKKLLLTHCVKSVCIRSFSGPYYLRSDCIPRYTE